MLLSSIIFIVVLLIKDFRIGLIMSIVLLIINYFINKSLVEDIKKLKFFMFFYMMTCFSQVFISREGQILFSIFNYHITMTGVEKMLLNFFKINSLVFLSWLVKGKKVSNSLLVTYEKIIETIIEMIPEVFSLFKKRTKFKEFYKKILLRVYRKL